MKRNGILVIAVAALSSALGGCASEEHFSWCPDENQLVNFSLSESGKTVSICADDDSSELTYFFGALGEEPELEYSGPLLASIEGVGIHSLSELATIVNQEDSGVPADISSKVSEASASPDSGGFVHVSSVYASGGAGEAYIFRRGGWEYSITIGS